LGSRAYGAGAAAQVYYGTDVSHLTLAQIAMIAGLPQAPSTANPLANPQRALARRGYVLGRMLSDGYITQDQYNQAMAAPLTATYHEPSAAVSAPYLAEMVRNDMVTKYGDDAYTAGYSVITTIDSRLQPKAVAALRKGLLDYDQRHGWRGPVAHVELPKTAGEAEFKQAVENRDHVGGLCPSLVIAVQDQAAELYADGVGLVQVDWNGLKWARKYLKTNAAGPSPKHASEIFERGDIVYLAQDDKGNWSLAQVPNAQSALVSVDPFDGAIVSLVGGFDFSTSKFNRVTQAHRQPGSSFKPFYYSAALEDGFTPASVVNDAPVVVKDPALGDWRPGNYEGDFSGPTRLRNALAHSLNLVSIRVLQQIGIDYAVNYVQKFGFNPDELPHNLSMALGSASLTPLEMARGYAVFANHGFRVTPYYIQRIEDGSGKTVFEADPQLACDNCSVDTAGVAKTLTPASDATPPQMPKFAPQVITPQNDWLMTSMMQDVINHGTGQLARRLGRDDLAGKTGTTNDWTDAWFDGFNNDIVTVVWVGNDQPTQSLGNGEQGALAALPIWTDFMGAALQNVPDPADPYPQPPGLVRARIDPKTGLLVSATSPGSIWEYFEAGHLPAKAPDKKKQGNGADLF
ncbi:MAG TPA: penicillin-binding transpeptidase domain-containing protein, partial [Gammaproteobacteria bacterium]